jgi:hypothetical protein
LTKHCIKFKILDYKPPPPPPSPHSILVATTTRAMKETCDLFCDILLWWKVEFDDHLQQDAFQTVIANPYTLPGNIHYANGWKFLQRLIWCEESRLVRNKVCFVSFNFTMWSWRDDLLERCITSKDGYNSYHYECIEKQTCHTLNKLFVVGHKHKDLASPIQPSGKVLLSFPKIYCKWKKYYYHASLLQ